MTINIDLAQVARDQGIPLERVQRTAELLDEGNTVPFITRYRKDETGGLDEEQIRGIQEELATLRQLAERKATILKSIESLGKLTEDLAHQVRTARTSKHLEDLYLPFKPKKQTLATIARQRGLEPLALEILNNDPAAADPAARAAALVNPAQKLASVDDVLAGVRHILAEYFSERPDLRSRLRRILQRSGTLVSVRVENAEKKTAADHRTEGRSEGRSEGRGDSRAANAGGTAAAALPPVSESGTSATGTGETGTDESRLTSAVPSDAGGSVNTEADSSKAANSASISSPNAAPVLEAGDALSTIDAPLDTADSTDTPTGESPSGANGGTAGVSEELELESESGDEETDGVDDEEDAELGLSDDADDGDELSDELADESEAGELAGSDSDEAVDGETADGEPAVAGTPEGDAAAKAVTKTVTPKGMRATAIPMLKLTARQQARAAARDAKKKKRQKLLESLYKDYYNFKESLAKLPPHRLLAINRGERSQVLRVRIEADHAAIEREALELLVQPEHPHASFLKDCVTDALSRLVVPSLEREVRREMTDKAERHAVDVFIRNLRTLLLQPPVHGRRVLAIDPGFRSGCKLAILDEFGNLLDHGTIHIIGPEQHRQLCRSRLVELIRKYQISVLAIGNGTACRETEQMVADVLGTELRADGVEYVIVNEAGASVYSTSPIGREELPKHDATVRSAASIGRRLLDPLSELVKINPANIGVGLYQHDLKAKHLRDSLDAVVESCVNYVGVDVNTASPALLRYVSGLNQLTARRLYEYRLKHGPFHNREQLKQVPGFGDATYIQSAGFLKIYGGDTALDATWVHPESYEAARRLLERIDSNEADLALEVAPARKAPTAEAAIADVAATAPSVFGGGVVPESDAAPSTAMAAVDDTAAPTSDSPSSDATVASDAANVSDATVASDAGEIPVETPVANTEETTVETSVADASSTETVTEAVADSAADAVEPPPGPPRVPLAQRLAGIDPAALASELSIGALTLRDMLAALSRPRRDPREDLPPPVFRRGIVRLEDLAPGMELSGTVLNVVDFGVFVDIGLSDSALVHISRLADRFIKDPHEVVGIGDVMKVWVVEVDKARRRVSLTAIAPGSERPRESRPPRGEGFQGGVGEGRGDGRGGRRGGPPGPQGPGAQGPGQGGGQGSGQGGAYAPGPGGAFGRDQRGSGGGRFGGGPRGGDRGGPGRGGPGRGGDRGPGGFGGQRGPGGNPSGTAAGPAASGPAAVGGGRGGFGGQGGQSSGSQGRGYGGGRQGGGFQGEGRGGGRGGSSRGGNPNRSPVQHEVKSKKSTPERPITKGMIEGVEPMRTFGDLLQFYQKKKEGDDGDASDPKSKR